MDIGLGNSKNIQLVQKVVTSMNIPFKTRNNLNKIMNKKFNNLKNMTKVVNSFYKGFSGYSFYGKYIFSNTFKIYNMYLHYQ